jgi:hypothetical protein
MESAEIVRLAVEAEESGRDSLGSAASNRAAEPGPRLVRTLRWLMGHGPYPRRQRSRHSQGSSA